MGLHDGGRKESAVIQVTMDEAKERLADLINAAVRGETVLIETEAGQDMQIVPVTPPKPKP
jgi:antitoxin (DNA-binding transcriptional repressor) of toxin-antitoxin stability system